MEVREGTVTVEVPDLATDGTTGEVFYNPRQELNRDVTIATLRAYADREPTADTYLDANTATGIRGVRAAAEGWSVTCCDRDPRAVDLTRENLERNDLDGAVLHRDANAVMHEHDVDVIDIDPFGSPIAFVDAALSRPRHLVCVTATDTAPLCGAHFRAGIRRYGAVPRNTEYHTEMGLRILLSALCRTAARYDIAIEPVLSHAEGHYVRTYLTLDHGATVADGAVDQLGTLWHCPECLHRDTEPGLLPMRRQECPACESEQVLTAGPIWLGPSHDPDFVAEVRGQLDTSMGTISRAQSMLETIGNELDRPTHYDQHVLCKRWNRTAPAMDAFLGSIEQAGYRTSRAHYAGTAFKTDAPVEAMREITEP